MGFSRVGEISLQTLYAAKLTTKTSTTTRLYQTFAISYTIDNPPIGQYVEQVVWVKLINNQRRPRNNGTSEISMGTKAGLATGNDITPLSLNDAIITPDKRLRVHHRPPSRWVLTIDNVGQADDKAYYLCQVTGPKQVASSASSSSSSGELATNFIGGARLNVLGE